MSSIGFVPDTQVGDGRYTVKVTAEDNAGNLTTKETNFTLRLDKAVLRVAPITNPGFEAGDLSDWKKSTGPYINVSEDEKHSGKFSFHYVEDREHKGPGHEIKQTLSVLEDNPLEKIKDFKVDAWVYPVRCAGLGKGYVAVNGYDYEGQHLLRAAYILQGSNDHYTSTNTKHNGVYWWTKIINAPEDVWYHLEGKSMKAEVDEVFGEGTWDSLKLFDLEVQAGGWANGGDENNYIEGYIDDVQLYWK